MLEHLQSACPSVWLNPEHRVQEARDQLGLGWVEEVLLTEDRIERPVPELVYVPELAYM